MVEASEYTQEELYKINKQWVCGIYQILPTEQCTVYPKKYAHGFCFAVLCCGYTLTDFPISIRLTSLALWQSNDCPSASKATLMNMDKYFIMNDYITTTKQSTTKPCAYFLGYTVFICTSVVCLYCNVPAPTTQLGFEPRLIAHSESRASAPTDSEREASKRLCRPNI